MQIKSNIVLFSLDEESAKKVLDVFNSEFKDMFESNGKFSSKSKQQVVNLEDETFSKMKSFVKENKSAILVFWMSDDIGKTGIEFFDGETGRETSMEEGFETPEFNVFLFLVSCGATKYLEKMVF